MPTCFTYCVVIY